MLNFKLMSYLDERIYEGAEAETKEKLLYWSDILGKELVGRLKGKKFKDYICHREFTNKENFNVEVIANQYLFMDEESKKKLYKRIHDNSDICFEPFFIPFVGAAIAEVEKHIEYTGRYQPDVLLDFGEWVCECLQSVCMRSLIANMHMLKRQGLLKGDTSREEYTYYCEKILGADENREKLFEDFPVLYRCVCETLHQKINYFVEIIESFDKDISGLYEAGIIETNKEEVIQRMRVNFSDTHRGGRQVVQLLLKNGKSILYKPHSMENEQRHLEILSWFEEQTGIVQKHYPILSARTYSWCSIVEKEDCRKESELREYYRRLGVQLFLAYVLGTKDLHSENIIASGAYPVLVDLETLVNLPSGRKGNSAEAELYYQLSHSVLYTGLLPFYSWTNGGKGVNASAISGIEGQVYSFKIPVVVNPGTSEMQIAYVYPRTEKSDNLAFLNGIFKEPYLYEKELISGFEKSYRAVIEKREEFARLIDKLADTESRYLVADTQRYHMQLAASYHPDLLCDGADREIFLNCMWLGRDWKDKKIEQIVESEINDLLCGDIPYFSYRLNQTSLLDSKGKVIEEYFEGSAIERIRTKVKKLDERDLKNQSDFIHVSMQLMPEKEGGFDNGIYGREIVGHIVSITEEQKKTALRKVTDKILDAAIYNRDRTDVSWYGVQLMPYGKNGWEIKAMNLYFYSGIAGMAVLFHKLRHIDKREEIAELVHILDKKLFTYTEKCREDRSKLQSKCTGMYEGEASIVYAYLCIYETEHREEYLRYAEAHSEIVVDMLENDVNFDLLSGNAGAARVLIRLYEITGKRKYLAAAQKAVAFLERAAVRQETGIGWITEKGIRPMAGMAHGSSGIMIPFAQLWKYTGSERYIQVVEEILEYENSLYDERIQNWRDVRGEGAKVQMKDDHGAVAWCHGAAGILSSRILCLEYVRGTRLEKIIRRDIERAYNKVRRYPVRDSWGLCHGTCGNMMILKEYEGWGNVKDLEEYLVSRILEKELKVIPQEEVNYGIMLGWGGIAFALGGLIM